MDESLNPFSARVLGFIGNDGNLLPPDAPEGDHFRVLINMGSEQKIHEDARVLVFALGPELTEPETGRPLGYFEVVRGTGRVASVQTRVAVVRSSETKTVRYQKPVSSIAAAFNGGLGDYGEREEPAPFRKIARGDYVRFI